jgi:hypothetical protein
MPNALVVYAATPLHKRTMLGLGVSYYHAFHQDTVVATIAVYVIAINCD